MIGKQRFHVTSQYGISPDTDSSRYIIFLCCLDDEIYLHDQHDQAPSMNECNWLHWLVDLLASSWYGFECHLNQCVGVFWLLELKCMQLMAPLPQSGVNRAKIRYNVHQIRYHIRYICTLHLEMYATNCSPKWCKLSQAEILLSGNFPPLSLYLQF